MSRRFHPTVAALAALGATACQGPQPASPPEGTSLVVMLVVDQLPEDLLARYEGVFDGGLRRILGDGLHFTNATHDHAATVTAVGHTTLSTGVYPARHGIVWNEWVERDGDGWREVYSVSDPSVQILGHADLEGMGPAHILRPGIADWILARDPAARVVSISKKERAAIGLAAQALGEVYWIPEFGGEFVTSTAYATSYPEWVVRFNREQMPRLWADTVWESVVPAPLAALSRPDTSRWEYDRQHTAFPHLARDHAEMSDSLDVNRWRWNDTPFPDRAVVSMAIEALDALDLGRRGTVDYLAVSLSQTDRVGHTWGPGSREQLDNLLRLDDEIGRLLDALDARVGSGRWVLAFSSDHGVIEIPEVLADEGQLTGRISRQQRDDVLARIASAAPAGDQAIHDALSALPFVAGAYTFDEIERGQAADSFAVLYAHSHSRTRITSRPGRSGVYVRYPEMYLDFGAGVTTHGSPYYYDRHIPVVFLGGGIRGGTSTERVATIDVAPTLATLAGVPVPSDLDGHPIPSVVRR